MMNNPKITKEEVAIIKKAQAGDILAFNRIFKKYKGFVDHILFMYIKDMDEAKDMTNIVFLKVHDKLSQFTAYESFGGWLRVIANHVAIDYLRETNAKKNVMGSSIERLSLDECHNSCENDLVNRFEAEEILKEFEVLPERTQRILRMHFIEGMTIKQISEALRMPTGTIKSILARTMRKIKTKLITLL